MESRKKRALEGRIAAAKLAYDRPHPEHIANGSKPLSFGIPIPIRFCHSL